jgi:polysaccharide export outer membrane protein
MTPFRALLSGPLLLALSLAPTLCLAQNAEGIPVGQPSDGLPLSAPAASDPNKILGVGDQLSLVIVEDRSAPVSRIVTDTGDIEVPWIGRMRAAGKTTSQLAGDIKSKLEASHYYTATVKLAIDRVNPRASVETIYVSGEVAQSGPQRFAKGERVTVSAVILRAGGFGQFANERKVKVTRKRNGGSQTFLIDVKGVLQEGKVGEDLEVRDGDYIFVPRNFINF